MILNRSKQSKSETPTRGLQPSGRITPILAVNKKNDPFLKELREVYDKQNIHPNVKENRTKSYQLKPETHSDARSPVKKPIKTKNVHRNTNPNRERENEGVGSHSKSSELYRVTGRSKGSNRKSQQKDELMMQQQQEEYFPSRQERREKKMKVTLKDVKKHRKSIQQSDGEYMSKPTADKQSLSIDSLGNLDSTKGQLPKNQQGEVNVHTFETDSNHQPSFSPNTNDLLCINHPQKRATHTLESFPDQAYCQRCAINFATKGHRMSAVKEVGRHRAGGVREERIGELKDFLFQLDKMQPLLKRAMRRVASYRSFLTGRLEEESRKLDVYYQNLCTVLKNSYDSARTTLKLHYDAVLQEVEQRALTVELRGQEIASLKEDILPNISSIIEVEQVNSESFRGIIDHNYDRVGEIARLMQEVCSLTCNYYQYRFENVEDLLVELRGLISPTLEEHLFDPAFQTDRKPAPSPQEQWLDPFRMSFGKNCGSAFRF